MKVLVESYDNDGYNYVAISDANTGEKYYEVSANKEAAGDMTYKLVNTLHGALWDLVYRDLYKKEEKK